LSVPLLMLTRRSSNESASALCESTAPVMDRSTEVSVAEDCERRVDGSAKQETRYARRRA